MIVMFILVGEIVICGAVYSGCLCNLGEFTAYINLWDNCTVVVFLRYCIETLFYTCAVAFI